MSEVPPVTLPRSARFGIEHAGGARHEVLVAWPESPPPPAGFPVIWLLDAHATFGAVVDSLRSRAHRPATTGVEPAIVVGISHAIDGVVDPAQRTLDFTPAIPADELPPRQDGAPWPPHGGAEAFGRFLTHGLRIWLDEEHPVDATRHSLVAHSLAGLFAFDLLARHPSRFAAWHLVSPSLWWLGAARAEERLAALRATAPHAGVRVSLSAGEFEERLAPWEQESPDAERIAARRSTRRMVGRTRDMAAALAAIPGLDARFTEYPGEDHAGTLLRAIHDLLRGPG